MSTIVIDRSLVKEVGSIEGAIIVDFFAKENAKPTDQSSFSICLENLFKKLDLPISISTLRRNVSKLVNLGYISAVKSKTEKNKLYYYYNKTSENGQAYLTKNLVTHEDKDKFDYKYMITNIQRNIGYRRIVKQYGLKKANLILNILENIELSNNSFVRVNSQNMKRYKVLRVLNRVNMEDVANILERYKDQYKNIKNEFNYMLTALYNQVIARVSSEDRYGFSY